MNQSLQYKFLLHVTKLIHVGDNCLLQHCLRLGDVRPVRVQLLRADVQPTLQVPWLGDRLWLAAGLLLGHHDPCRVPVEVPQRERIVCPGTHVCKP